MEHERCYVAAGSSSWRSASSAAAAQVEREPHPSVPNWRAVATLSPTTARRSISGWQPMRIALRSRTRSEEHTSELQSRGHLVCRLLLEKKKKQKNTYLSHQT